MRPLRPTLPLLLSACYVTNPNYDPTITITATTSTPTTDPVDPPTTATTTPSTATATTQALTSGSDAESATGTSTGVDVETTTAATATTNPAPDTTDTDTDTTGGLEPGWHSYPAVIAACVFVDNGPGHGPPPVCRANADAQNDTQLTGLLYIDTEVHSLDGEGRPARTYLRFDLPALPPGLTLSEARVRLRAADSELAASDDAGEIIRVGAFSERTLAAAAPPDQQLLSPNPGEIAINQERTWTLPADQLTPGQPLYLGVRPITSDGVFYRGDGDADAPVLDLLLD